MFPQLAGLFLIMNQLEEFPIELTYVTSLRSLSVSHAAL
jgi:hypothetical protein